MQITADHVVQALERIAAYMKEHRDELTRLDSPIGDADHGINLDRGCTAVIGKLPTVADEDIGTLLKTAGMTLISTVGGASGPLYGTAFMRASTVLADAHQADVGQIIAALDAALEGIQARGKAQPGEKTMIDSIMPALAVLHDAQGSDEPLVSIFRRAVAAAESGMQATIPMLATKGRASYLGERSIGHQDPGATSAYYMMRALLDTLETLDA
jgi:dihydroxyacetone kinase-like protein